MEELLQIIDARIKKKMPLMLTVGKAVNINGDKCDVDREGMPTLHNVRLNAVSVSSNAYFRITPKEGSYVLALLIENNPAEAVIVATSEIEQVELYGDNYGGIVISQKVADELNEIKQDINTLKTVLSAWVVVPGDGGAALKTAAATWAGSQLVTTNKTDLENDKVKHGG